MARPRTFPESRSVTACWKSSRAYFWVVATVGEPGSGRATLLAHALRRAHPRIRVLTADVPEPDDVEAWLLLWSPELRKPDTAVVVENVDALPAWAAHELHARVTAAPAAREAGASTPLTWSVTARGLDRVPVPLRALVGVVVPVAPLRVLTTSSCWRAGRPPRAGCARSTSPRRQSGPTASCATTASGVSADVPGSGRVTTLDA